MAAQITVSIVTQGVPTLAPFLQADLSLTRAQVGLFNSAIMSGSFISLFFAGWLVDIKGERTALFWGNLLVGLSCIAIIATNQFDTALAIFFLTGIGAAFSTPAGSRTVMRWFPPAQRGAAMGLRQTGIPIGGAIAAALLPIIALTAGWRAAIVISGISNILTALLCWARYPAPDKVERAAARAAPAYGFRSLLTRDIVLLGISAALLPLGQFALVTYLALYLKETQGIAITVSAMLLVGAQIAGAAGRLLWGVWSDRLFRRRRKPTLLLAGLLSAVGSFVLGSLPGGTPVWVIALIVLGYAFNAIGWHGSWISLVSEIAGPEKQGRTIGAAMTLMYAGIISLPPLFGLFVDYTHHWAGAWQLSSLGLLVGTCLILPVREPRTALCN